VCAIFFVGCAVGGAPSRTNVEATAGAAGSVSALGGSGGATGTGGAAGATASVGGVTGSGGTSSSAGTTGSAGAAGTLDAGLPHPPADGGAAGAPPTDAGAGGAPATGSPVALHGTLKAQGNHIVGADGKPVQLKGMSLYWSQFPAGASFYNADVINWLVKDWHISIIRIAIAATGANDGDYLQNPQGQLQLLDTVVQAAFANGIYAVVDWHDSHAPDHLAAAKTFFDTASKRYGSRPNTIYEIWNEPRGNEGLTWTGNLKPYAETISKVIRANDPSNLMVVGTPFWDQQPSSVIGNPVADVNVAYTLHFYAGYQPHFFGGDLGKNAQAAVAGGIPLFVTEWGTTDPSTQTMFNEAETRKWMAFLDQNAISSCNWSISGANEGSSALKQGASTAGGWKDADLSPSGLLVRSLIRGP
jgi:endoglucanase